MLTIYNADTQNSIPTSGLVVLDFYADWCGPCRAIAPTLDQVSNSFPEISIIKINVDDFSELAEKYDISSIPTLVFIKDGLVVDTSIGVVTANVIESKIKLYI